MTLSQSTLAIYQETNSFQAKMASFTTLELLIIYKLSRPANGLRIGPKLYLKVKSLPRVYHVCQPRHTGTDLLNSWQRKFLRPKSTTILKWCWQPRDFYLESNLNIRWTGLWTNTLKGLRDSFHKCQKALYWARNNLIRTSHAHF